ncbi:hypothetical protein HZB60_10785 [candidate division KSB1 bacterium]|nr:hypothetical protein [candidate division KSB1 bacterium]
MVHVRLVSLILIFSYCTGARADDFKDFRIPAHHVQKWYLAMDGSYAQRHSSGIDYGDKAENYTGGASGYYSRLFDSDPRRLSFSLRGSGDGRRSWSHHDQIVTSGEHDQDSRTRQLNESVSGNADARLYPWAMAVGGEVSLGGAASYYQYWNSSGSQLVGDTLYSLHEDRRESWDYHYSGNADLSVGYGRVRDVNAVYLTRIFEERLLESGYIESGLTAETRRKVAALLFQRSDYKSLHNRPDRFFWSDIEKLLRDDPAVRGRGLDAYNLYRIDEPLGSEAFRSFLRQRGYFVGPVLSARHRNSIDRSTTYWQQIDAANGVITYDSARAEYQRSQSFDDDVLAGLRGEYFLPIGMRWQLGAAAEAVFALNDTVDGFETNSELSAEYVIAGRWQAAAGIFTNRRISEPSSPYSGTYDTWSVGFSADLRYFVEDKLSINLDFDENQDRPFPDHFYRTRSLSFGISYGIAPPGYGGSRGRYPYPY